jgi:hypothetical protein
MEDTMRASSDSIAQLAAAMAKAQSELVNPVKSLTAVIERGRNGGGAVRYQYAPLSSGLEIVRKILGKYELAVTQTTHVDRHRGLVLLTTTLAHGSGEWISALWPICHISDIGHPKLMGAALTYARRYGLFTMVGLAGDDDLDGPDLDAKEQLPGECAAAASATDIAATGPDSETQLDRTPEITAVPGPDTSIPGGAVSDVDTEKEADAVPSRPRRKAARRIRPSSSSPLRSEHLDADLARIADTDALFLWALEILPFRNELDESQRAVFDAAFLARADAIGADPELLIPFAPRRGPSQFNDGPGHPAA